jgi:hypothetical protein
MNERGETSTEIKRVRFGESEDALLRALVLQYGLHGWREIAKHFPGRNVRQCRDRWKHYLSGSLAGASWSAEADEFLMSMVGNFGRNWKRIAAFFPDKSENEVHTRHTFISRADEHQVNTKPEVDDQVNRPAKPNTEESISPKHQIPMNDIQHKSLNLGDGFWFSIDDEGCSNGFF